MIAREARNDILPLLLPNFDPVLPDKLERSLDRLRARVEERGGGERALGAGHEEARQVL
jgi:hypothetical protein